MVKEIEFMQVYTLDYDTYGDQYNNNNIFDKKISDIGLDGMIWRLGAEWTF